MEKNVVTVVLVALFWLQFYDTATAKIQQPSPQKSQRGAQTRQSFGCSKNEFTCGDKQCIPASAVCDGQNNCQDGTDEDNEHCTVIQTGMCSGRKRSKKFCDDLPDGPVNTDDNLNSTSQFFCRSDVLKDAKSLSVTCVNRIWTPITTLCSRVCKPLTLPTSNITCLRNGVKVDCNKPLLIGTKIKLQCEFYYEPTVKETVCQENGEWNEEAMHCTPKCGRQFKAGRRSYSTEIRPVDSREFPWNAAIYYTKPGTRAAIWIPGTIISPYLVVTTAINFYADFQQEIATVESLSVVVAKVTKSAKVKDDQFQRLYRVKNIYFTETGLQNSSQDSLSSENIALIELHEKLVLSPSVYPVCVNWGKNDTLFPQDGELGQVLHTLDIHQANAQATTQSEILQTIALRFVSREQCLRKDFIQSVVRTDNFCGEQIPAPAPCDGAYVFLEMNTNLFFLHGLVDGVTPTYLDTFPPQFTNTFIDLSVHIDWINAVRRNNEDRMVNKYLRLEALAANSSDICAKNNDEEGEPVLDVRVLIGKERRRKSGEDTEGKVKSLECLLPTKLSMNAYNYSISCPINYESNSCRKIEENSMVPEYTLVKLACMEGFTADMKENQEAVCFKGQWNPALAPCSKHCDKLPKFDNADFACYEEDRLVKCNDYLKIGSKVISQCKRGYQTERSTESHDLNCQDDGKWEGAVPECVKKPARDTAQSKTNTPVTQTRNQNGSSRSEGGQPSLQPRTVVRNSKNQTSSNPNRGFIQTNPSRTPVNSTESQSEHVAAESRPKSTVTKNRRPQVEVQTKNGLVPQNEYVENEWNPDLQNLNSNVNDDVDEKKTCSNNEFSCGKQCMPLSAVCNGTIECKDGQDESPESCKILSTDSCTPNSDSPKYCEIETLSNTNLNNRNQPPREEHAFLCNSKYMGKDSEGIPLNCVNGVSTPSTIPCTRICRNITIIAAGLDCYRNGVPVDCKKPLLSGTEIKPRCEPDYKPNFNGSTCNDKGEWDHSVVECIPECGTSTRRGANMTKTIRPAQFREFPWNVAVYKKSKNTNSSVLFAGIIITPTLVLTNAHCCATEVMANDEGNMDMFEITVAKRRSSTSYVEEDEFQKTIKVKAVHLMDKSKPNSERLALIELAEKITSCPAVQPVCVNWRNKANIMAKDGTLGLVAHWRTRDRTNSDTVHEMLQAVAMTLHTTESCQKRVHKDFLKYLTNDAFCVDPITTMTPAHRGAGFVYADRATKLNYVQGVIYFTGTQEGEPTSFTNMFLNISTHIDWINNVRRKAEKRTHHEWILNKRIAASNDVCNALNGTNDNNDENIDSQNALETRSDFSTDGNDDFMENGCVLPDKTWLYLDYNVSCLPSRREKECKKANAGGVVPEFASLTLSCNDGYVMNNSEEVVCFRKNWSPPIEPCRRICDKLELENVTLKCFWEDKRLECDSELTFGATAIAECAPYYHSEKSLPKLFCDEYGHWKDSSEVKCSRFDPWEGKDEYFKYSTQI